MVFKEITLHRYSSPILTLLCHLLSAIVTEQLLNIMGEDSKQENMFYLLTQHHRKFVAILVVVR